MSIAIPPRKGLIAKTLRERHPELTHEEIGRALGMRPSQVEHAAEKVRFGRNKPKSRAY